PATLQWSSAGSMHVERRLHTATLLQDGRVLVAGGYGISGTSIARAELYDPASNSWIAVAPMAVARHVHGAALLADGRVLIVGGSFTDGSQTGTRLATSEIFDPVLLTWSAGP